MELLTISQVAKILNINKGTLYKWIKQGKIKHLRLGPKSIRFRSQDIEEFLQFCETKEPEVDPIISNILNKLL